MFVLHCHVLRSRGFSDWAHRCWRAFQGTKLRHGYIHIGVRPGGTHRGFINRSVLHSTPLQSIPRPCPPAATVSIPFLTTLLQHSRAALEARRLSIFAFAPRPRWRCMTTLPRARRTRWGNSPSHLQRSCTHCERLAPSRGRWTHWSSSARNQLQSAKLGTRHCSAWIPRAD